MAVLISKGDNARIIGLAGQLLNFYSCTMSNECAISREKLHWSINSLKYIIFMAESFQIIALAKNIKMRTAERNWIENIQTVNQSA